MSEGGRTTWFPRDAAWHRRELIVELGEEFGPAAISVLGVLDAWAREQGAGGAVKGGYRILSREAFCSPDEAQAIVGRAADLGALDDLELAPDGRRFTCRVSGWKDDMERALATVRKREQRARADDVSRHVPVSHDVSRSVTPCHAVSSSVPESHLQDKTRQDKELQAPSAPRASAPALTRTHEGPVLTESVVCPECEAPAGERCRAARGGHRGSYHLKRHHLVGELLHLTAKAPPPRRAGAAASSGPWAPSLEVMTMRAEHFPDELAGTIASAVESLRYARREVTADAVRALLTGDGVQA